MHKCIRRVARLLSWSVRAAVEPGQLPAAEISREGRERRGHFPEVRTAAQRSHRESGRGVLLTPTAAGESPPPLPPATLGTRCRHGGRATASHERGDAAGVRGGGVGGQLAGLPPLFEAASCRSVANSPHLPVCDFLLTCGWTRGRRAWARRCSPRGRDPPWAPGPLAAGHGLEGAIPPWAGLPPLPMGPHTTNFASPVKK